MNLYYFLTRYLYKRQKIVVYCCGVPSIEYEHCGRVVNNDKYEELMKKDIVRIFTNSADPDTLVIHVQ